MTAVATAGEVFWSGPPVGFHEPAGGLNGLLNIHDLFRRRGHAPAHLPHGAAHDGAGDRVGARPARVGPVLAVGSHPDVDQAGIDLPAGLPIDLETLRNAQAEVVRENVGLGDELVDDLLALGGLEVNLDAFLAGVGPRVGDCHRGGAPSLVQPAVGGVDLDDPRAEVGQQRRAVGSGLDRRQVEDGDSGQRVGWRVGAVRPGRSAPLAAAGSRGVPALRRCADPRPGRVRWVRPGVSFRSTSGARVRMGPTRGSSMVTTVPLATTAG